MRQEAALLATIFLNFAFWFYHGNALWFPLPFPVSALIIATLSAILTLLFLIGPALAVHRSGRTLFETLENSLGSIPTHAVRAITIWYLISFLDGLLGIVSWQLPDILRRNIGSHDALIAATLLLAFLGYTALQNQQNILTMAQFTNRLGVAVLLAAVLRLHETWPTTLPLLFSRGPASPTLFPTDRFVNLAAHVAPLALLGSCYSQRLTSEKEVLRAALLGFATPLTATLVLLSAINFTTFHSAFYQPSLETNITMALWGGAAHSAKPGPILIALLTTFGVFRFGIRAIPTAIPNPRLHLTAVCAILASIVAIIAWRDYFHRPENLTSSDIPPTILAIVTAILSADALHNQPTKPRQIDWPATTALILALTIAYTIAQSTDPALESWGHPWLFPAYLTAFTITLAGRKLRRT